ncbi:hypothetical protein Tco_0025108 [Tanacetum coccineum]
MTRRVESSKDQESLGDHEDASKQGRSIDDIDADVEVTLVDETQEWQDEDLMFDTGVLDSVEMPMEAKIDADVESTNLDDSTAGEAVTISGVEDSVAPTIPTIVEETLAQTLMEIKAAKPKAKGIVFHDQEEQVSVSNLTVSVTQPSVKDKGKGIMIELEVPLKRKDQVALDEQMARDVQAQLEAKIIEEEKLARKQEEEANIALIESWDNTQAMMEADFELAQRLQTEEQGEISIEERSKLFVELMNKKKKHFAMLKAEEKRRKPPTKAQKRNQMSTYLKNMGGYKHNQLKSKSFEEIQKMFANEMRRVNTFIPIDSEVVKSKKEIEESSKGTEDELESNKLKKAEDKESDEVEEIEKDDEDALKKYLVIKKDDDIAIDVIPLATRLLVIVDYKLHKEGLMAHYELIRADGTSKRYTSMIRLLQGIDREDLQTIWKLVQIKHGDIRPKDEHKRVLWGDLKVMFEPDIKSDIWRNLQGYKIQKLNIKFRGGLLGLKRLQGHLRLLLLSDAGEKITTADYNCFKTFYCQEDKDGLKR